ncbi:MAG: four helix bundle protein [bacterium]|nr:four helix bundle protein [bacterium]
MKTQSYKDLIVWQKSIELVVMVYKLTTGFPREEIYGLSAQMRRAAVTIASNIAEGYGRRYRKEYKQFLSISYASACELETQLIITERLQFGEAEIRQVVFALQVEVSKMLRAMIVKM